MEKFHSFRFLLLLGSLCFLNKEAIGCIVNEKAALLEFKAGLRDPHDLLSSWNVSDCCQWVGVRCNNVTGHVVAVDLRYWHLFDGPSTDLHLRGKISASILKLTDLNYLDLSSNDFGGIGIPDFIGSITGLSYLNLSNAGFGGRIPHQLGNLSGLRYLDLNSLYSLYSLDADSLQWLSGLSSLQYLDMSSVNLGDANDWSRAVNMIPALSVLKLPNCQVKQMPTSMPFNNLTSLATLDLSYNQIYSIFPSWFFTMSSLRYLNLEFNHLQGSIPDGFLNMTSLEFIHLGNNELVGNIPQTFRKLCNLKSLDLSSNNMSQDITILAEISSGCAGDSLEILNLRNNNFTGYLTDRLEQFNRLTILDLGNNLIYGSIPNSIGKISTLRNLLLNQNGFNGSLPESIGQLAELRLLDLSSNSLGGVVSESHFANLSKLEQLSLASNSFEIRMSSFWFPPFRLKLIGLRLCKLGPEFPSWLQTQKDYIVMDLSDAKINDNVPEWFWNLSQQILMLDLSNNMLSGKVPTTLEFASISILDLSSNKFDGPLPLLPASMEYVDFSDNFFTGSIDPLFAEPMPLFSHLFLSNNYINGTIPTSICKYLEAFVIDLSNNSLSGELPMCWSNLASLTALNLANNNLSGEVLGIMSNILSLKTLHLGNNHFKGELPVPLQNCGNLVTLDLGENSFSGAIPSWIGESLPFLRILRLRSNKFYGNVPPQLSLLTNLQILDLANNALSGNLPASLGNITAMAQTHKPNERMLEVMQGIVQSSVDNYGPSGYVESLLLVMKGREQQYSTILQYVASIDLSSNNFTGYIPQEFGDLYGLQNLNLSSNHLTGEVPAEIGKLKLLESLDLSVNNLTGPIPTSMSLLNGLSHLNLSYNNFSGRIPSGFQLQTLVDPSIYMGNPNLCGPPLDKSCVNHDTNETTILECSAGEDEYESEKPWLYSGVAMGFAIGLCATWGTLLLNETLGNGYFKFIDGVIGRLQGPFLKRTEGNGEAEESDEQIMLNRIY